MSEQARWERTREIFLEAMSRRGGERVAFVADACAGDERVRAEVDALLASLDESESLEPAFSLEDVLGEGDDGRLLAEGERIGKYRVERRLNSGGMGDVYLVTRVDDYRDQAAIKVMRQGLQSTGMVRRFHRERQMLALLDHPNISRLLDGGATDGGLPYLVMEYIDGGVVTEYCRERALPVSQIVSLFLGACDAVRYAHQKLVVHRDIKPANMLITREGVLKLLDFGVAGLIEGAHGDQAAITATSPPAMTLRYSSPEQVLGRHVSTSTDVYSLGLVLYELLAGRPAFEEAGVPRYECERQICEIDPPPPSAAGRRASSRSSAIASVPRELDDIVMMAIRKDPADRYPSVEAFADDLGRFLAGQPVSAHRGSYAYRAKKFVLRHKASVAFAAVVAVLVAGAVVGTSIGMARARAAAALAARERDESREVLRLFETTLASSSPFRHEGDVSVFDLLRSADELTRTRLADEPDVAASVHAVIGRVYLGLFRYADAVPHLQAALDHDRADPTTEPLRLADALSKLARAKSDLVFTRPVDCGDVVDMQLESLAIRREVLGQQHTLVAEGLADLALAHWAQAPSGPAPDRTVEQYEAALAMFDALGVTGTAELAEANVGLGHAYFSHGRIEDAGTRFGHAVEIYRAHPELTSPFTINALNAYGSYLLRSGRRREAIDVYSEAVSRTPDGIALDSTVEAAWQRVGCRFALGEGDEAGGWVVEAIRLEAQLVSARAAPEAERLGLFLTLLEQGPGAEAAIEQAFPAFASALPDDPDRFGAVLDRLVPVSVAVRGVSWTEAALGRLLKAPRLDSDPLVPVVRARLERVRSASPAAP